MELDESPTDKQLVDAALGYGFLWTIESTGRDGKMVPEEIEFCRSRICVDGDRWRLTRWLGRSLATFGVTHRYPGASMERRYREVLKAASMGELTVSSHVPCVAVLAWETYLALEEERDVELGYEAAYKYHIRWGVGKLVARRPQVSGSMRASVARAYGVSVGQQLAYERTIGKRVREALGRPWQETADNTGLVWHHPEDDVCLM
jgi:hypothetical protein